MLTLGSRNVRGSVPGRWLLCLAALVLLGGRPEPERFTLVVMPDTQWASKQWPHLVEKMTEWIVEKREELNIRYVLHVGDMVQDGWDRDQWKSFDKAMRRLDGKVPYILAVGNHDLDEYKARTTDTFNAIYPRSRFEKLPGFGGTFPEKKNDSSYHTFKAGGMDWLVVSLRFSPRGKILTWANDVIARHPDHRAIVLTHAYLNRKGRDEHLWNTVIKRHPNVAMAVCGHVETMRQVSKGEKGNTVYEMLFDWQDKDEPDDNSYLAILEFDPDRRTLSVRSYSPHLDRYKTDENAQFRYEDVPFLRTD